MRSASRLLSQWGGRPRRGLRSLTQRSEAPPSLLSEYLNAADGNDIAFLRANSKEDHVTGLRNLPLRLVDSDSDMYRYTEEDIQRSQLNGFPPFWAFVWPGGYGLTRYIQENESLFGGLQDTTVLDFGCGCGSATIAAQRAGARTVISNDIDPLAVLMTSINCARNCESLQTAKLFGTTQNCLSSTIDDVVGLVNYCENKNVPSVSITDVGVGSTISCGRRIILVGDMLYDGDIGPAVLRLVNGLVDRGWAVYIGDPGRDFAKRHLDAMRTENVAEYELPSELKAENNGLLSVCVRRLLS